MVWYVCTCSVPLWLPECLEQSVLVHSNACRFWLESAVCLVWWHGQRECTVSRSPPGRDAGRSLWCSAACWYVQHCVLVWRSGSALVSINRVNLRWARLVSGWVTVSGFSSRYWTFISICNQPPRPTQPGYPFVVGAMSSGQRAVTPCGWRVKAGMVRMWVAGKTVWFSCYTRTISEHYRGDS